MRKAARRTVLCLAAILSGPLLVAVSGAISLTSDWRTANRESAQLAPPPATTPEAVVQVYAARAFNWRGLIAVHTWIATKAPNASEYTVHQVLGWNRWYGKSVVESAVDLPDRYWYDAKPEIVLDVRGEWAAGLIAPIEAAVAHYPYADHYRLWPGPNSNTFIAFIAREVPGLNLNLPVTAIGKDYLPAGAWWGAAPSGTGFQFSLGGVLGVLVAKTEGLEINIFGLVFGLDPLRPALKLPGLGRIGVGG
ncbi:MAG: DUF3750 domain-containing protein [Gammaproteobacteria bacterium]|nr:DUF3750 domain-containing protein [Gammaproteobacteria bacterium]